MASDSVSRVQANPGGSFTVRWTVPGSGVRSRRTFATRSSAEEYAASLGLRSRMGGPTRTADQVRAEIESRVDKTAGGCWLWNGFIYPNGYGQLKWKYQGRSDFNAHRISYRIYKGEVPKGLEIDHLCRVRRCVNPDHLEAVTHQVNIIRGYLARKAAA